MLFDIASAQLLGSRSTQEDNHWNSRLASPPYNCTPAADPNTELLHFVVADGMGGYEGGELASAIAVETTAAAYRGEMEFTPPLSTDVPDSALDYLELVLHECHFRMLDAAAKNVNLKKMGSTAIIGMLTQWGAALVHCGDSRAYLLREGVLTQLTSDHTLVQLLVDRGLITAEDARKHPRRGVLSYALGRTTLVQRVHIELKSGDRLLICTDGLTEALTDTVIAQALSGTGSAAELCAQLMAAAQKANPKDNTTATVVTVN